jgi:hypothetical protein
MVLQDCLKPLCKTLFGIPKKNCVCFLIISLLLFRCRYCCWISNFKALDMKFGVYVNLGSFKSIMNRCEKIVCTTLKSENNVRETGSMTQPLLNKFSYILCGLNCPKNRNLYYVFEVRSERRIRSMN